MLVGTRELRINSVPPVEFRIARTSGLGLQVEPAEGTTPATVRVSIHAGRFDTGWSGEILIQAGESEVAIAVGLSKRVLQPTTSAIVNGASFRDRYVSPGSLATIFGDQLTYTLWSPDKLPIESPNFAPNILIAGGRSRILAPPVFISPNQFNVQIPNLPPGPARLEPPCTGGSEITFEILEAAPGIFTYGDGRALVQNSDGSVNAPGNAARAGELGVLYLTGQGPLDREVLPGHAAPSRVLARATLPVEIIVDGRPAEVLFAGLTPGFVGLCQVNFLFPELPPGDHAMTVQFGSHRSNEALVTTR